MHSSKSSSCVFKYILYKLWKSLKFIKKKIYIYVPSIKMVPVSVEERCGTNTVAYTHATQRIFYSISWKIEVWCMTPCLKNWTWHNTLPFWMLGLKQMAVAIWDLSKHWQMYLYTDNYCYYCCCYYCIIVIIIIVGVDIIIYCCCYYCCCCCYRDSRIMTKHSIQEML